MRKAEISKVCFCTSLFLLTSFLFCSSVNAFSGETNKNWNSMSIEYSVSGAIAEERDYRNDSVYYNGTLGSGYLTVEGTAYNRSDDPFNVGKHMNLEVKVRVGDDEKTQRIEIPHPKVSMNDPSYKPNSDYFKVSVPIPSDATHGSFSIHLEKFTGDYASHYVSGTFTREVAPGGTTSSGDNGTQSGTSGLQGGYPPADDTPWVVIIGGLSAVAAAAAVMISKARKKDAKKQTKNEKDNNEEQEGQDELVGYILQLESFPETVSPKPGSIQVAIYDHQPHTVKVTAWQVKSQSGYQPAPHAVLQVQPPAAKAGLSVSPLNGQGSMTLSIKLTGEIKAGSFEAVVTASADGISTSAAIDITIIGFFLVVA
jgi:hypothetical protein